MIHRNEEPILLYFCARHQPGNRVFSWCAQCRSAAFAGAVLRGEPTLTPPAESVANMRTIDDIYLAAGMEPRRGAAEM